MTVNQWTAPESSVLKPALLIQLLCHKPIRGRFYIKLRDLIFKWHCFRDVAVGVTFKPLYFSVSLSVNFFLIIMLTKTDL